MIARFLRWLRREPTTHHRLLAVHLHFAQPRGGFSE